MIRHEELSKLIFKKILLDHPLVLANFIVHGLRKTHVEIIESMIDPDMDKIKEKIVCIKKSIIISDVYICYLDFYIRRRLSKSKGNLSNQFSSMRYVSSYCYHVCRTMATILLHL